jgi:hypothetical protein
LERDCHLERQEHLRTVSNQPSACLCHQRHSGKGRSGKSRAEIQDESLFIINLVMMIERRYKVRFALGELQDLKNVGDLLDLL